MIAFGAILGAFYWGRRWNYIIIHHSGGDFGNLEYLRRVHSERQTFDPINAIPYHYVVGNGNGLGMGEVVSDWRTDYDLWGAHVTLRNLDRNFRGIGICLIGNFETKPVPEEQYQSLLQLTKRLMAEYHIPVDNVTGHGTVEGEHTKCPGKNFPLDRFIKDLS